MIDDDSEDEQTRGRAGDTDGLFGADRIGARKLGEAWRSTWPRQCTSPARARGCASRQAVAVLLRYDGTSKAGEHILYTDYITC